MINNNEKSAFNPFDGPELAAVIPLTQAQTEIWASVIMNKKASLCYNEAFLIKISGGGDISLIKESVFELVSRHDILRSRISPDGKKLNIYTEINIEIPVINVQESNSAEFSALIHDEINTAFDLINGPLFKTSVYSHKTQDISILISAHHIICDGWSLDVLLEELSKIYNLKISSSSEKLKPAAQFTEYAEFLQSSQDKKSGSENFWKAVFNGEAPVLNLPTDFKRPEIRTYDAARIDKRLNSEIPAGLKKLSTGTQSSLFMIMLTSWAVQISRLTGQRNVVIGVPFSGQSDAGMYDLVGHCVSLLPVLVSIDENSSFRDQIIKTRSIILDAIENQHISFGSLIQKIHIQRDLSRIPLVSVSFTHTHQYDEDKIRFGAFRTSYERVVRPAETFELSLNAIESSDGIELLCYYNTSLFHPETVARYLDGLEVLLKNGIKNPETRINRLGLISVNELGLLEKWGNITGTPSFPAEEIMMHSLFEEQCQKHGEKTAAFCGSNSISYKELNEQSNQLAAYISKLPIRNNSVIGISLERSISMLTALLGVLKAGHAYLPMDPMFPEERLRYMFEDSGAEFLITQESLKPMFSSINGKYILIDSELEKISEESSNTIILPQKSQLLAYMIYTSGSTGKPKGVKIQHRAAVNFLKSMSKVPGISENDRLLAVTTLSFDISVLEIFLPLSSGAAVIIAKENEIIDPVSIANLIEKFDITLFQATPATWNLLIAGGWKGKRSLKGLCGGEPMTSNLAETLVPKTGSLWNMYGPTETTVWSTCCRIEDPENKIHVGRPIDNTTVYILDSNENILPAGVTGEVCIGGLGLSAGYHNREDLDLQKFIIGPDKKLLYKTGDLGRFTADGNIELFGRADDQIKLRGFRIEPGEIENAISSIEGINAAVVKTQKFGESDDKLVAFIKTEGNRLVDNDTIISSISLNLPKYMIPSAFINVNEYPYTPNGKIDRKALVFDVEDISAGKAAIKPQNEMQSILSDIWSTVLKTGNIGIEDNFFDLGGHSLLIAEVQARLQKNLNRAVSIIDLFSNPTIKSLSSFLEGSPGSSEISSSERAKMQRAAFAKRKNLAKGEK